MAKAGACLRCACRCWIPSCAIIVMSFAHLVMEKLRTAGSFRKARGPNLEALDNLFWISEYFDNQGKAYKVSHVIIDAMGEPQRTAQVYSWAAMNRGRVFPRRAFHSPSSPVSFSPVEYYPGPTDARAVCLTFYITTGSKTQPKGIIFCDHFREPFLPF